VKRAPALFALLLAAFWIVPARAQRLDPVKWSLALEPPSAPPGASVLARVTARIDPGWHLYSLSTPKGGPIPTTLKLLDHPAAAAATGVYQPAPKRKFDQNFKLEVESYDNEATFLLIIELKKDAAAGPAEFSAQARYQVCDDRQCLLPVRKTATARLIIDPSAAAAVPAVPAGYTLFDATKPRAAAGSVAPSRAAAGDEGLSAFLLVAFGFGIAAVFTPCVFPMIPITVSFFLNRQSGSRGEAVLQAAVFCLGIIVLFTSLGLITTAALGPFGAQQLGSSPWVNGFIALVFLVFSLSLLGAFEITIPSSVLTKLDRTSQRGGVLGTLLMGLTFSLTAFACVGPFVGTLLAGSLQSGGFRPAAGMICFAAGLAAPFFLLALFPSYLQRLPKSGGWMARVKIVLGFVILAVMLKYVSNIDSVLQWNLLTRERFLACWVVLFALPGLYLLGFLRMEGVRPDERVGLWRLMIGILFLAFAISLVPGMFGGGLGELDAYVPLAARVAGPSGPAGSGSMPWMKNQYREALDRARAEGKLVFVSFTGYACTNCHWMKANMFVRPEVAAALGEYVLVELYTDGTDAASEANQQLLERKFSTIAIPFYAILDADENVVATFAGLTRDPQEFLGFLNSGKGSAPAGSRAI